MSSTSNAIYSFANNRVYYPVSLHALIKIAVMGIPMEKVEGKSIAFHRLPWNSSFIEKDKNDSHNRDKKIPFNFHYEASLISIEIFLYQ